MIKKKLKLPVIRIPLPEARTLSMDEYLRFVQDHLKYTFDRKSYEATKKVSGVNVRFKL